MTDKEVNELASTDNEGVPEFHHSVLRKPSAGSSMPDSAPWYTYNSTRTQAGPSECRCEHEPESEPDTEPSPNNPDLTPAMLLLREREQAIMSQPLL